MNENGGTPSKQLVETGAISPGTKAPDGKEIDLNDIEKSTLDNPVLSADSASHAASSDSLAAVSESTLNRDGEHTCCDLLKGEEKHLSNENKQNEDDDVNVTNDLDLAENLPELLKNALDMVEGLPNVLKKALNLVENLPGCPKKLPAAKNESVEHIGQLPTIAKEFEKHIKQFENACKFLLANEFTKADAGPFLSQTVIFSRLFPQAMESLAKVHEKFDSLPVNTENE